MAFALVLVGAGLGGSIAAPLLTRVIAAARGNWRAGWFCLCAVALMAALMSMFVKNRPEDAGQVADGDAKPVSKVSGNVASLPSRIYRTRDQAEGRRSRQGTTSRYPLAGTGPWFA
jgi:MFS transporter, OFA family, oxalate/formate antiporter